jgi:hypothetical protein
LRDVLALRHARSELSRCHVRQRDLRPGCTRLSRHRPARVRGLPEGDEVVDEIRCVRPRHRAVCDRAPAASGQSPSWNMGMNEMPTIAPSGDCSLATV